MGGGVSREAFAFHRKELDCGHRWCVGPMETTMTAALVGGAVRCNVSVADPRSRSVDGGRLVDLQMCRNEFPVTFNDPKLVRRPGALVFYDEDQRSPTVWESRRLSTHLGHGIRL